MTALATKLDERVRLGDMPGPRERPGFRMVAVVPFPRNSERPAPVQGVASRTGASETRPCGEPANALEMSAHGGAGNAFGYGPLHDNLARVDSALEHVRGPELKEAAPKPSEAAVPKEAAAVRRVNSFGEGMARAYSPLLDGRF